MIHTAFRSAMKQCWTTFIDNVEPRDITDRLFQGDVITEDEQERVLLSSETRQTRCQTLADILRRRIANRSRLGVLLDALNASHYDYIAAAIDELISASNIDDATCNQLSSESHDLTRAAISTGSFGDVLVSVRNHKAKLHRSRSADGDAEVMKTLVMLSNEVIDRDADVWFSYMPYKRGCAWNSRSSKISEGDTQAFVATDDSVFKTEYSAVAVNSLVTGVLAITELAQQLIDDLRIDCLGSPVSPVWQIRNGSTSCLQSPVILPPSNRGRTFATPYYRQMFDTLSLMVNSGDTELFRQKSAELWSEHSADPEALCILLYLLASSCIFASDFDGCRHLVKKGLELTPFTRLPNQVTVQLLSLRVWHQLKEGRQHGSIQSSIDDAMQIVCQDPVSCSGMAAGWIYVDEAKQLMSLTVSSVSNVRRTRKLLQRVEASYRMAMRHFMNDKTHDGPYGCNFVAVKLASALLACDDALRLVTVPDLCSPGDIKEASNLLKTVDNSPVGVAEVLQPLLLSAQADYKFRTDCMRRADQLARQAKSAAKKLQLQEEISIAQARCEYYSRRASDDAPKIYANGAQSKCSRGPKSFVLTPSHESDASCEGSESEDRHLGVRNVRRQQRNGKSDRAVSSSRSRNPPRFYVCTTLLILLLLLFLSITLLLSLLVIMEA